MAMPPLSKELREFILDQVKNQGVRSGRKLASLVNKAGFISPQTKKPYKVSAGYNWLSRLPELKESAKSAGPSSSTPVPAPAPELTPAPEVTPSPRPAPKSDLPTDQQVIVILCPLTELQKVVSELRKPARLPEWASILGFE